MTSPRSEINDLPAAIRALRRLGTCSLLCKSERRAGAAYVDLLEASLPEHAGGEKPHLELVK